MSEKSDAFEPIKDGLKDLGCDLHIHVLPALDDGAPNMQESLAILDAHYKAGIRRIIATPHIRSDFFLNSENSIRPAWEELTAVTRVNWPDLAITYSAEYFGDDYFYGLVQKKDIIPLFENYVLVETSLRHDQPYFIEVLKEMILNGYQPVLAHPERYQSWHRNPERYAEIYELGVIFQMNLLSLGGCYGPAEQIMAERLIQQGWVGAVGSDIHRASQYRFINNAVENPYFQALSNTTLLNHTIFKAHQHE